MDDCPPPPRRIWLDGAFVRWEQATVHVLSHSLQRGSLVFDYLSVHATPRGPAIFRLADHAARFVRSAELVGLPLRLTQAEVAAAIVATVRANPGATAVKVSAFVPSIEIDVVPADDRVSVAVAAFDPVADVLTPRGLAPHGPEPLRVHIERQRRGRRRDIVPPHAKAAASYLSPMAAKWAARRAGYDEILLLDREGFVAEGPTCNVFLVDADDGSGGGASDGALRTPPERRILPGITRASVIALARHDGLTVRETRIRPEELAAAAEVFLTSTSARVAPVASVDGAPVGGGPTGDVPVDDAPTGDAAPGPVTRRLRARFTAVTAGADAEFEWWLTWVGEGEL